MSTKRLVLVGLLISSAIALSGLESLIPIPYPVPGAKLGLANIITVFCLYKLSIKEAVLVSLIRIILVGFLFGSLSSIIYALSGAFLSLVVMVILIKLKFNIIPVSLCGAIAHNIGQLITACIVTNTWSLFISYFPFLFILGAITGIFVGFSSLALIKAYEKIENNSGGLE